MKITFSVFPPRAALRNEAESSDCKIKQIRNGLSTILFSSCHDIIPIDFTREFLFCTLASLFSIWLLPLLHRCCHTHGYSSNMAFNIVPFEACVIVPYSAIQYSFSISSLCLADIAHNIACDAYNVLVCLDDEPHCEGLAQPLSRVH